VLALACAFGGRAVHAKDPGDEARAERVTEGYEPWLSPNCRYLAFQRTGLDLESRDSRGQPTWQGILHVRDLATGEERPAARNGTVTGWSGDDLLILGDGSSVRASGNGDEPRFPDSPNGLMTPSWIRSRDGRRVAFTVRGFLMKDAQPQTAPKGRKHTIYVAEGDAEPRPLDLGEHVNQDAGRGLLSFSPDGRRLAFRLGFMHYGQLPHPRIGVFDLESDTCTWVADEAAGSRDSRAGPRPWGPTAWAAWDARGTRFVFVKTAGARKRDLYTATADGKDVRRLTVDGKWKASPCLDPAGERCAYWVLDERPEPDEPEAKGPRGLFPDWGDTGPHRLRVVMLRTGEVKDLPTPPRGSGTYLQWSADGRHLCFGWTARADRAVYRVAAPAAPEVEAGTPVVNLTRSKKDELLDDLASKDPNAAEAALRRAWRNHDPDVTAAVIDILRRWTQGGRSGTVWVLTQALDQRHAVGAVPVLLDALASGRGASSVTGLLLDWGVEAGVPFWRAMARSTGPYDRGSALVALARFGAEADWERVRASLKDEDPDARDAVARALAHVRDARSVDILIPLLDDDGFLYTADKRVEVRHKAAESLVKLTGRNYGGNREKWSGWWESSDRTLPPPGGVK
jgi:hypothetical protein